MDQRWVQPINSPGKEHASNSSYCVASGASYSSHGSPCTGTRCKAELMHGLLRITAELPAVGKQGKPTVGEAVVCRAS